ncbi:kinase-like domain-containing protein [Chaetomium fimeti]|uniref:Kinase-like domain-containing protein n=1 Tax=Chaetomium fimeti TaxID=1854472 RepID=A0AAE0HNH1_9PEZI|nr:kinase-like domain-containing protein [Chaetomium fimeti]
MASRCELPFFGSRPDLPTVAEILASKEQLSQPYGTRVVRVRDHFAVKFGQSNALLQEGENQLFVQESSRVPVPTVYAVFHDEKTNLNFIVQEYIPGQLLGAIWDGLSYEEKSVITSQLRRNMDELRAIPSPGYCGGLWGQPNLDIHFGNPDRVHEPHSDSAISGPKATEEEWADTMCRRLEQREHGPAKGRPYYMTWLRRLYRIVFRGHRPVFNHGDFSPGNIMIRDDDKSAVIIDWQYSGWCPSFWEYCGAMEQLSHRSDWGEWLPKILDELARVWDANGPCACHRSHIVSVAKFTLF